ncbi:MAG: efflux transporter outer membrane subunit [Methylovulum sp.]|jgi:NodT family efflux transporter outer membrane factor (OMF) lipoprotein|nr:efflux transporter outer membrane subunit [Methylovulum sp.]MCF7999195.1 efflux transporter outer membrane subunit [Methylovulum sp.]
MMLSQSKTPPSRIIITSLLLSLTLSACTLGPDFKRPDPPNVSTYRQNKATEQALVLGKELPGQWWTLYHSKPLSALIAQAIKHNPDLQSAHATLVQAQELAQAKKGSLLPSLDASAFSTRQQISGAQFGNPSMGGSVFSLYNTSVKVSYTLDVFGAIRRQIENLSAQADYQRFQLEAAFLTIAANIVTTALQEASLRAQITATEQIIDAQAQQLNVIQQQFDLGSTSKAAVLAQQSTLAQTRTYLPPLQQALAQTRHRLTTLVGTFPSTDLAAQFNLDELSLPDALPLSLPAKLVEQRPDIRAQEAALHAASAQIGVVTASVFPDFTISSNVGSIATQASGLFMPGSEIWNLTANLLQPVFHGGDFTHKRQAAVASYEQAAAQYRSTVLKAFQDVADTLSALEFDENALKTQDAALQAAQESLSLTQTQFNIGAVSYVSLLNAQRDYQQARMGRIKAQAARLADTAALFQALGGGWWQRGNLSEVLTANQKTQQVPCRFFDCWTNPLPTSLPAKD